MRMNELLKYLTACDASSGLLYPQYPNRLAGKSLTSVMVPFAAKVFLNSSSVSDGGRPRTNMREEAMIQVSFVIRGGRRGRLELSHEAVVLSRAELECLQVRGKFLARVMHGLA